MEADRQAKLQPGEEKRIEFHWLFPMSENWTIRFKLKFVGILAYDPQCVYSRTPHNSAGAETGKIGNTSADWRRHRFVAGFARIRTIWRETGQRPNSCESGYHLAEVLRKS